MGQIALSVPREPFRRLRLFLTSNFPLPFYAAPMALRCWKHSRQKTGRPCVGRKGTVVSFPHCEQFVFVSDLIGEACPPKPPPLGTFRLPSFASFGFVLEALVGEKHLFAGREHELRTAFRTLQHLI